VKISPEPAKTSSVLSRKRKIYSSIFLKLRLTKRITTAKEFTVFKGKPKKSLLRPVTLEKRGDKRRGGEGAPSHHNTGGERDGDRENYRLEAASIGKTKGPSSARCGFITRKEKPGEFLIFK